MVKASFECRICFWFLKAKTSYVSIIIWNIWSQKTNQMLA